MLEMYYRHYNDLKNRLEFNNFVGPEEPVLKNISSPSHEYVVIGGGHKQ